MEMQVEEISMENTRVSDDLKPKTVKERHVGAWGYMAMWLGDGFNIGNITLGSSLVVAGIATMNLVQTIVAAGIAILIISLIFTLNDRFGYVTGAPYMLQLRLAFGKNGAKFAGLLRGIPAVVWYGFQSWTGALALNQITTILFHFDNTMVSFVFLQFLQIFLTLNGFKSIKVVTSLISIVVTICLFGVFVLLIARHQSEIITNLVKPKGTWGLPFFGFIVAFLGNYTAIFESAADYSRELVAGISNKKRCILYLFPIGLSYGITILTGAMLAAVTGISSPVNAMAQVFNNNFITMGVSLFIVFGVITTNLVANVVPPVYVLSSLFNIKYRLGTIIVGLLAIATFPWLLVQDSSAEGLALFIKLYSVFLGPMTAIILLEYYYVRKQQVNVQELYTDSLNPDYRWDAIISLLIGAGFGFLQIDLAWMIGFAISWTLYWFLHYRKRKK